MIKDIYKECPTFEMKHITLRKTKHEDAKDLLKCYSDEKVIILYIRVRLDKIDRIIRIEISLLEELKYA